MLTAQAGNPDFRASTNNHIKKSDMAAQTWNSKRQRHKDLKGSLAPNLADL